MDKAVRVGLFVALGALLVLAGCSKAPQGASVADVSEPFIEGDGEDVKAASPPALNGQDVEIFEADSLAVRNVVIHGASEDFAVKAEVADSDEERAQGLSGRTELKQNTGMLFVFDDVAPVSFHMQGVPFLVDILFLDEQGVVQNMATMTPCRSNPCPIWDSRVPVKYALELPGGALKGMRISRGTQVSMS